MGYKNNDRCLEKVDEDEPIFVLRAQDATMIEAIIAWLRLNPKLPLQKYMETHDLIKVVRDWQQAHPDRVKAPD